MKDVPLVPQPAHRDSAVVVLRASRISLSPCRSAVDVPRLTPSTVVVGRASGEGG